MANYFLLSIRDLKESVELGILISNDGRLGRYTFSLDLHCHPFGCLLYISHSNQHIVSEHALTWRLGLSVFSCACLAIFIPKPVKACSDL